jgi:hypothetical protein
LSATLEARAEIAKLARLLGVEPSELDYLTVAQPDDVRRFREQLTDALYDRDRARFGRLAAGSRVLPSALAATIAEHALGPMLCARLSGLIEPAKAVDIAKRLQPPFLAEVAIDMDPRRAKDVIARVPADVIAAVSRELASRGEVVTMGRFVAYLGDGALRAAMEGTDDVTLLQTAFVLEGKERLDHIVALLPADRLPGMVRTAETHGLWAETLDLLCNVSGERVEQLIGEVDTEAIRGLAEAVQRDGLWPQLLAIAERMTADQRDRIARPLLAAGLDGQLAGLIAAVESTDRWETGLRMLAALPPDLKGELAPVASSLERSERMRALEQARALGMVEELGPLVEALERPT